MSISVSSLQLAIVDLPSTMVPGRPKLMWPAGWWNDAEPAPGTDHARFLAAGECAQRADVRRRRASVEFIQALRYAERLWILDPQFDEDDGAKPLADALVDSSISQLRLQTGSNTAAVADEWCNVFRFVLAQQPSVPVPFRRGSPRVPEVEWRTSIKLAGGLPCHDRFAIVDHELWHFGATVGGSHRSLNAFSRGWDAAAHGAVEFFGEIWGPL
jgi:hypothetical protein